jgi:ribosome production factor 2
MFSIAIRRICSKAKNARTKRILEERAPKIIENPKSAVFVRGNKTGQLLDAVLHDMVCRNRWVGPHGVRCCIDMHVRPY